MLRADAARTGESLNQLIVDAVSAVLEADRPRDPSKTPLEQERERIRWLLRDMVAQEKVDYSHFPEHLRPRPDLPDTETLADALGEGIDLSGAIIEEREEETR